MANATDVKIDGRKYRKNTRFACDNSCFMFYQCPIQSVDEEARCLITGKIIPPTRLKKLRKLHKEWEEKRVNKAIERAGQVIPAP